MYYKIGLGAGILALMALTACTTTQRTPTAAASLPNPASAYCGQNGGQLELRTDAEGGVAGMCVFADGSECDEWTYYRGECGQSAAESPIPDLPDNSAAESSEGTQAGSPAGGFMPPGSSEEITDWWGVIKSTGPGAQYDDYFERQDLGQSIYFGIDAMNPEVKAQIEVFRDTGRIVHLYGTLLSNVPDYNGSQVQVDRIEVEG